MDKCPHCNTDFTPTGYEIINVEYHREVTEKRDDTGKIIKLIPGATHVWLHVRLLDGTIHKVEVPDTSPPSGSRLHFRDGDGIVHCEPWL